MERAQDVIVIGAGIVGCAVGQELARRGAKVRIFDARTIGAGATRASAGLLAPYIEGHERGGLFSLAIRSLALYDDFVKQASEASGIPIEYRRCGTLEIAMDRAQAEALRRTEESARAEGVMQWLDAAAARAEVPALSAAIEGALLVPTHGYVSAPALTEALAWAAVRQGAQIEAADRVAAVRREGSGLVVLTAEGRAWPASHVVVAAGSWSGQLGIEDEPPVAVRPIRGQLLYLAWPEGRLSRVVWGPDCYVVPWENGTVLVGATVEDVGFDERATAAGVRDLLEALCELLPEAWKATFIEARVGLRPASPDGLPLIRRARSLPNVIYATGHYRNGILLAPLTAQLAADLVGEG